MAEAFVAVAAGCDEIGVDHWQWGEYGGWDVHEDRWFSRCILLMNSNVSLTNASLNWCGGRTSHTGAFEIFSGINYHIYGLST